MIDFKYQENTTALGILKNILRMFIRPVFLFVLLACFSPCLIKAQIEKWDSLTNLARMYYQEKDYLKSNEYYQQVIDAIKPFDKDNRLTNKIKGTMALNYTYIGVSFFKKENYSKAKTYFEKAIEYAERDPKILSMANTWLGDWYSTQALAIRISEENLQNSIKYSILAEKYYGLANAHEKLLKEQVSRATVLGDIAHTDEARILLQQVISKCEKSEKFTKILAKALNELGAIEQNCENYQSAIQHLERSFNISITIDKQNAIFSANRLLRLFQNQIPDPNKAELWKKRINELND